MKNYEALKAFKWFESRIPAMEIETIMGDNFGKYNVGSVYDEECFNANDLNGD